MYSRQRNFIGGQKLEIKISKKGIIISGITLVLTIIGITAVIGYHYYQTTKESEKKVAQEKVFKQTLATFYIDGSEAASSAEELGDTYLETWGDAIFKDGGAFVGGSSYTDFNDALEAQKNSYTTNEKLVSVDSQITTVQEDMKQLKDNLTSKNSTLMEDANKYYDELNNFVSLAENPIGSYTTYSTSYTNAKTDYLSAFNKFSLKD